MSTLLNAKPAGTPTWADLTTPDLEASRQFYQAVFGWEYDIGGPEFGGYTTARLGDRSTVGLTGLPPGAPPMPAAWGLYFATDDIEADVARAEELGAKVLYPTMTVGEFGSMATLVDPTDAQFSLWKAGQHVGWQMVNEPDATAWYEMYSPNAKKALDFYTALLNATAELEPGGLEYYTLKHGDDQLCGIMQIDPSWGNMPAQWVSYFAVANADETVAAVRKHGGQMMGDFGSSPWGRIAALRDAHGATFKIVEVPAV